MQVNIDYKTILVPVDFTDTARKTFYVALKYATRFNADTFVLHVHEGLEKADSDTNVEKTAAEIVRLEDGVKRRVNELFEKGGLKEVDRKRIRVEIRGGDTAEEIMKFAIDNHCELIVIGHNPAQAKGLKKLFKQSPAIRVVEKAPCDVVVVKPQGYDYDPRVPDKYLKS